MRMLKTAWGVQGGTREVPFVSLYARRFSWLLFLCLPMCISFSNSRPLAGQQSCAAVYIPVMIWLLFFLDIPETSPS